MADYEVRFVEVKHSFDGKDEYGVILDLIENGRFRNRAVVTMSSARVATLAGMVGPNTQQGTERVLEALALWGAQTLEGPPFVSDGADIGMEEPDAIAIRTVACSNQALPSLVPRNAVHTFTRPDAP